MCRAENGEREALLTGVLCAVHSWPGRGVWDTVGAVRRGHWEPDAVLGVEELCWGLDGEWGSLRRWPGTVHGVGDGVVSRSWGPGGVVLGGPECTGARV